MTDATPHCAGCGRQLGPDDQFCARCGTPTATNVDPEATLVVAAEAEASASVESAAPLSSAAFNDRIARTP